MLFSDSYLLYLTPALLLVAFIMIGASVRILREFERASLHISATIVAFCT
jgi:hypothetical protein